MPLVAFDHINIRTLNLERMVAWYEDVLGLRSGPRPEFPVPGAWLYLAGTCVIHLIEADPPPTLHTEGESLRMEHMGSVRGTWLEAIG
ncbi:VOC family protein [Roseicyclus salinarum]|uniref:VOC family protein n=1 Tax=Roseicyclus salinarum TaxID=3036773 RepID=UPI003D337B49